MEANITSSWSFAYPGKLIETLATQKEVLKLTSKIITRRIPNAFIGPRWESGVQELQKQLELLLLSMKTQY
jgi:hypothetical protein